MKISWVSISRENHWNFHIYLSRQFFTCRDFLLLNKNEFCSVKLLSQVWLWDPMDCSTPDFPIHHQLLGLAQTHVLWVSDAIQSSHPLLSPSPPPSIFPSIRVFSNESVICIRWPKYWDFSFSISPSNEYSGLISFRIDWLGLLVVQGTLKSLLQHTVQKQQFLRT